jgi:hypothetical protein
VLAVNANEVVTGFEDAHVSLTMRRCPGLPPASSSLLLLLLSSCMLSLVINAQRTTHRCSLTVNLSPEVRVARCLAQQLPPVGVLVHLCACQPACAGHHLEHDRKPFSAICAFKPTA